jgi:hypothetical protein
MGKKKWKITTINIEDEMFEKLKSKNVKISTLCKKLLNEYLENEPSALEKKEIELKTDLEEIRLKKELHAKIEKEKGDKKMTIQYDLYDEILAAHSKGATPQEIIEITEKHIQAHPEDVWLLRMKDEMVKKKGFPEQWAEMMNDIKLFTRPTTTI